ncbi:hypothetical protein V6N12_062976 [Hibiscus sabdariffa]|uniref:Reverse transcriptase zinc-binding domain-containing protein n=1 Tax=Hibiscus sabdariffa TaxID=183260 RepID=A0ABR2FAE7_9ROSI
MVADMVNNDGEWDWQRLTPLLPKEKLEYIASIQPPRTNLGEYQPLWRWDEKHDFTTRSAYKIITENENLQDNVIWKKVWRLQVPQRIQVFTWLALHGRLLKNTERKRRHLTMSDRCELCGAANEDIEHVLRSCIAAKVYGGH